MASVQTEYHLRPHQNLVADTSSSNADSTSFKEEAHVLGDGLERLAPEIPRQPVLRKGSESRVVEGIDQHATTSTMEDQSVHPRKSTWGSIRRDVNDNNIHSNDVDDLERLHNRQLVVDIVPADQSQSQGQSHMLVPLDHSRSASQPPDHADEAGSPTSSPQGVPSELPNFTSEILLVVVCSMSLTLYAFALGDVTVLQEEFKRVLGIKNAELPWLVGAYNTANGLSLVVSGSLMDLAPPKRIMVGAFAWFTLWDVIGVFSLHPKTAVLFYMVRAMQGVAVGVMVSGSLSILGRVYKPGIRKNRVFSAMSATAPFGFWLGGIQGGALKAHLRWIFGSNAIIGALCCIIAFYSVPSLRPAADAAGTEAPSLRQFDFLGAAVALAGFICLLFGLTQGSVTSWSPYTYTLVIVGLILLLACFPLVERYVQRPLVPGRLWKTKGFKPLMAAYFLGYGCYAGAWQFYAVQFWLRIQHADALKVALYLLPNAIVGVLATWIVSRTLHRVPGHYIYTTSMIAFSLGPVFFLPQTPNTIYWALSMPGVALVTFGPDLAFAAASIFITSNVAKSYQGSAGSILMMCQNLSNAVITAAADAVGARVDKGPSGDIGLKGLKAIWWFGFAGNMVAALMTVFCVRIPKEEEKEHVT